MVAHGGDEGGVLGDQDGRHGDGVGVEFRCDGQRGSRRRDVGVGQNDALTVEVGAGARAVVDGERRKRFFAPAGAVFHERAADAAAAHRPGAGEIGDAVVDVGRRHEELGRAAGEAEHGGGGRHDLHQADLARGAAGQHVVAALDRGDRICKRRRDALGARFLENFLQVKVADHGLGHRHAGHHGGDAGQDLRPCGRRKQAHSEDECGERNATGACHSLGMA